jgi:hypothetical protein
MMKKIIFILLVASFLGCDDSDEVVIINDELSMQEVEDLQFLKEEEKLARDVYLFSYDLYQYNVFNNISKSEQSHMDQVSLILDKYEIQDLSYDERGKFNNQVLQKLYDNLVSQSSISLEEAIRVGATIEDLDINDIDGFIVDTDHDDIAAMYEVLNCGSRNHMRAFSKNLTNLGKEYEPQFISLEKYILIIDSTSEKCNL